MSPAAVDAQPAPTRRPWTLGAKLGAIGGSLLLLALASIGLTLWVTWQLEGGAAAVNEAGRMRMQTWRLAQTLAGGDATRMRRADRPVRPERAALLRSGDPARPLFVPRDERSQARFADVQRDWQALRGDWSGGPGADGAGSGAPGRGLRRAASTPSSRPSSGSSARLTAILNAFQFVMVALTIVSAVALLYSAYLFVFNPLARLQAGLAARRRGRPRGARRGRRRTTSSARSRPGFNRMARDAAGPVPEPRGQGAGEDASAGGAARAAGGAVRGRRPSWPAPPRSTSWRRVSRRQVRRVARADAVGGALVRRIEPALPDAGLGLPAAGRWWTRSTASPPATASAASRRREARHARDPDPRAGAAGALGHCAARRLRHRDQRAGAAAGAHGRRARPLLSQPRPTLADDDRALLETLASHLAGRDRRPACRRAASARPRWPKSAACWRANCTTRSRRAWRS